MGPERRGGDLPLSTPSHPRSLAALSLTASTWKDSLLILVYPSFTIPFATWLLMGFFNTIPQELEDAALIHGVSGPKGRLPDRPSHLPPGDPDARHLCLLALRERVHLRVHVHLELRAANGLRGCSELGTVRGDVFFCSCSWPAALIPTIPLALLYNAFLDPLHQGLYRRGISLENRAEGLPVAEVLDELEDRGSTLTRRPDEARHSRRDFAVWMFRRPVRQGPRVSMA